MLIGEVELDPGQTGQIPTDVTVTETFPGDAAVREVLKYGQGRVQPFPVKGFKVGLNPGVEDQLVASWTGCSLSHERRDRAGVRSTW